MNLGFVNGVDGYVKLRLSVDKNAVQVTALGVTTELKSRDGSFYFVDEVELGKKGLFLLKCADVLGANESKAIIYPKGWHPGARQ